MKRLYLILFLFIAYLHASAQSRAIFKVQQTVIKGNKGGKFKKASPNFYEDEDYVVRKTCNGEFGGTVIFKDKKTGIAYYCDATCPVIVNKINGRYIVSNTLAHLGGFSEVIEIDNPASMQVVEQVTPAHGKGSKVEADPTKGRRHLLDTMGILLLVSFPYEGELYHITTDFKNTYVSKIEGNRLVNIGLVANESFWSYGEEVIHTKENHYVVFFRNTKGYLDIFGDQIEVVRYQ